MRAKVSVSILTPPPRSHRWRPALAVKLSFAAHAAGVVAIAAEPAAWPWIALSLATNHLALFVASVVPRSRCIGANITRLPAAAAARREVAITFDDGPDPLVTPRVLDILDRFGAKASFFCIAERALRHPELVRAIEARGHSVENHSYRHPRTFGLFGLARIRAELARAQSAIGGLTQIAPRFFRAPAGIRNPFADPIVQQLGLRYVSWSRRALDTLDPNPDTVLARLIKNLAAGDILLLHDGASVRAALGEPVVLLVLPRLLDTLSSLKLEPVSLPHALGENEDGSAR